MQQHEDGEKAAGDHSQAHHVVDGHATGGHSEAHCKLSGVRGPDEEHREPCSVRSQSRSALYASVLLALLIAGMRPIGHTHRPQDCMSSQLTSPSAMTAMTTLGLNQEVNGVPVIVIDQVWDPGAECGRIFSVRYDSTGHSPVQECTELNFQFLLMIGETQVLLKIPMVPRFKVDVKE